MIKASKEFHSIEEEYKKKIIPYLQEAPIMIGAIAKEFGVIAKVTSLTLDIAGYIKKDRNNLYTIYVNNKDTRTMQRFTFAYLMTHYLFHQQLMTENNREIVSKVVDRVRMKNKNRLEQYELEAIRITCDILIPIDIFKQQTQYITDEIIKNHGLLEEEHMKDCVIEKLASKFMVAKQIIKIRQNMLKEVSSNNEMNN